MPQDAHVAIYTALRTFASDLKARYAAPARGEPEAQLSTPVTNLVQAIGDAISTKLVLQAEAHAEDRIGIPDFAVSYNKLLMGFIELKAPGHGADVDKYSGRNRAQWERFKVLPNIIYTDGNEWALYQQGERAYRLVKLTGDITQDGEAAITEADARALLSLLQAFIAWEVVPPRNAKGLAELLAPLCLALREQVEEALLSPESPLSQLAEDWRELLFPHMSDQRFADAYAQTVTYALLLARAEGADVSNLDEAEKKLAGDNTMLSRALQVMTENAVLEDIRPAVALIQRAIAHVEPTLLGDGSGDPWLYFYEDFLAAYDPELRRDTGVYYTPVEVVHAQVRLVDDLLTRRLNRSLGFATGGDVSVLDPAVGTGTYLLGIFEHAMNRVLEEEGQGAVKARATLVAQNIHGFELLTGPFAVAQLRLSQAVKARQGVLPANGVPVYLTNTLDSPYSEPPKTFLFYEPIAREQSRALSIKERQSVLVCIGNPPYDRHDAASAENRALTGGWVRYGDDRTGRPPLFDAITEPAKEAGYGGHLKNAYNLYVYFWRWALWKVFEHEDSSRHGVVAFITASSFLTGKAFVGLRELMREQCDDVWVIDLGGEGRGTRTDENVFNIQTPVAITIALRVKPEVKANTPARTHYCRITGTRAEKLAQLEQIHTFNDLSWQPCPDDWHAPFMPAGTGDYFTWPLLTDLMPWQHSGVQLKRTWPIAPTIEVLERRWQALLTAQDKSKALRETPSRNIYKKVIPIGDVLHDDADKTIADIPEGSLTPPIVRYAYRSFDRQWLIADNRLADRIRPPLWEVFGDRQVYFSSQLTSVLGYGSSLSVTPYVPDLHFFAGRGAKDVMPLFRDAAAVQPNIAPELLSLLSETYGRAVSAEDWAAYLYGVLAHPRFTEQFHEELGSGELRVPLTKNAGFFARACELGAYLLWLHTYGERFAPEASPRLPRGKARAQESVPFEAENYPKTFRYEAEKQTLYVGTGSFYPVAPAVYDFEVSGLKVVASWLGYRMRSGSGKKSSPLDDIRPETWTPDMTRELLELLWMLEATLEVYPKQAALLADITAGEMLTTDELPDVPENLRKAPNVVRVRKNTDQEIDFE